LHRTATDNGAYPDAPRRAAHAIAVNPSAAARQARLPCVSHLLAEYPGYGPRAGKPGEDSLVAETAETVTLAHRQHGAPRLLIGESLGAAVAAAAGARQRELTAGLILITPLRSARERRLAPLRVAAGEVDAARRV
jgi:alpha-beta hydrolase superfamily lysophospholipase